VPFHFTGHDLAVDGNPERLLARLGDWSHLALTDQAKIAGAPLAV